MNSSNSSRLRPMVSAVIIVVIVVAFGIYQTLVKDSRPELAVPTPEPARPLATNRLPIDAPLTPEYRIIAPEAHLSAPISEVYLDHTSNWDLSNLFGQAGHLQGTSRFGQGGNFVLAGHVEFKDGSRGPFADLDKLVQGDMISLLEANVTNPLINNYAVTSVAKVQPDDFAELRNHGYEEITLITCGDWDSQTQTYLSRIVVHARPVGSLNRNRSSPTQQIR